MKIVNVINQLIHVSVTLGDRPVIMTGKYLKVSAGQHAFKVINSAFGHMTTGGKDLDHCYEDLIMMRTGRSCSSFVK